jgi:pimeloyl-ACP methyl ester carboxylesterase
MYVKFGNVETEAWFIDSFEEWRKAKNLSNFILLGHSFGGYVAAKYALKVIVLP